MPIPNIHNASISSSNEAALSLWDGYDTFNGVKIEPNDRQFFYLFGRKALYALESDVHINFLDSDLRDLIRVGRLTRLYLKKDIDYLGLNNWFNSTTTRNSIKSITPNSGEAGALATFDLLISLADSLSLENKTHHTTLASRILFFLLPNLQFFNLSSSIKQSFKLKNSNQLRQLWLELNELTTQHEEVLNTLIKPAAFTEKNGNQYTKLADSGNWWHRRVIDLAVISTSPI